jgi:hypothetical protein
LDAEVAHVCKFKNGLTRDDSVERDALLFDNMKVPPLYADKFALMINTLIEDPGPELALYLPFPKLVRAVPRLIILQESSHATWQSLEKYITPDSMVLYIFPVFDKQSKDGKYPMWDEPVQSETDDWRELVDEKQLQLDSLFRTTFPGLVPCFLPPDATFFAISAEKHEGRRKKLEQIVYSYGLFST